MVSALLWALIGGTVVGLLGKVFAPGDQDDVPLWLTILCGIGGVLIGNFLYGLFFDPHTRGIDWWADRLREIERGVRGEEDGARYLEAARSKNPFDPTVPLGPLL